MDYRLEQIIIRKTQLLCTVFCKKFPLKNILQGESVSLASKYFNVKML